MKRLHSDTESIVRSHAAWALGQIENPQSLIALRSALDAEADPEVISEIQSAIDNLS
jgi:HEAT repeat protein